MATVSVPTYSSGLSSKGSLLDETLIVLRQLDQGSSPTEVKGMVVEHDLWGKMTRANRVAVWKRIHARYLSDERHARTLAHLTPLQEAGLLRHRKVV